MINKNIAKTICTEFNLGNMVDFKVITEGVLNEKYRVNTGTGSFFVKEIKENNNGMPLAYICNVEHFMKSRGIPAVSVIKTRNGSMWLDFGDSKYLVYPYLEGDKSHKYSLEHYESMGSLLGKMHKVGQKDVPDEFFKHAFTKLNKDDGLFYSKEKKDEILSWGTLEEDDKKFLEYLEYKINLIPNMNEGSTHVRDAIVHSDFHANNIIFDSQKNIIGVCDWERSHYGSRMADLAHSIFSCFPKGYTYGAAIENAKAIMKGYQKEYPITREEVQNGLNAHACMMTFVPWMEEQYYLKNNKEAVNFIEHEKELVKLYIEGKIVNDLL